MSVLNYKFLQGHYMEEWGEHTEAVPAKVKARDKRDWKKQVQQEIEEMEQDND